ncbi:hypothetical protein [Phyllobacterium bourgognense]|uniref:Uncharacterized protein n=1 Tax=Phyllobacterium bourgognense TaxID=314236 RepID=A0A368Z7Y3_9HYPH|nr:hypothetical protein [Phyllobacterium bourgognense]RCW87606.1 hypothetical protein C7476_101372 [Phyllobacterium bourgognense]
MKSEDKPTIMFAYSLGRLSTVCFVIAMALPLMAISWPITIAGEYSALFLTISTAGWLIAGAVLHFLGLRVLRGAWG